MIHKNKNSYFIRKFHNFRLKVNYFFKNIVYIVILGKDNILESGMEYNLMCAF